MKHRAFRAACLALAALTAAGAASAQTTRTAPAGDILAGPYVNSALQTEAVVLWVARPGATGRCEVLGGAEANVVVTTSPLTGLAEQLHAARLSGLKPDRAYSYAVSCGAQRVEGSFRTLPAKGARGPLRFLAYSDPQGSPQRHGEVVRAVLKELPVAFLAISGDLSDDSSDWALLRQEFFQPAGELLRQVALWTARGNHEKDGILYRDLFVLPRNEACYSFDAGNVHYVVLEPYQSGQDKRMSQADREAMVAWLRQDLAAARADWTIVSYHEPTFNVAGHGSTWGRQDVLPVLEEHGVDIVLAGHSHLYERCRPIGPEGGKPIFHITHGGGGGRTYDPSPSPILDCSYGGLHYCLFTVEGDTLEMVAKKPSGEVIDRLRLVKSGGRYQKEVMDRALTTEEAVPLVKVFKVQWAQFAAVPAPGAAATAVLAGGSFPPGYGVTLEQAPEGKWTVRKQTLADCNQAVQLQVQPPAGLRLAATPWHGTFDPELTVKVTLSRRGVTSSCHSVPVILSPEHLAQLVPPPQPVDIPPAPAAVAVDGRLEEWADVPTVRIPHRDARSQSLRLAWGRQGLYGALAVRDARMDLDAEQPWKGDCLELNLEMDNRRRLDVREESRAGKILIHPLGDGAEPRRAGVKTLRGAFSQKDVQAVWRKTDGGYQIEFRVAAEALAPAQLQAGTAMGFHYQLYDAGKVVENFVDSDRIATTWSCPFFWGKVRLAER